MSKELLRKLKAMIIKAEQKFVKMTPRKLRLIADMVRKMQPTEAVAILPHVNKIGAEKVQKVVKTALANAKQQGLSEADMIFDSVQISEGPRLKRFRPVSRGRAHGYVRRMSHIRVTLKEVEKPTVAVKKETKKTEEKKAEKSTKKVASKSKKVEKKQSTSRNTKNK